MEVSIERGFFYDLLIRIGHNRIMTSAQVGLAALKAFGLDDGGSLPL